MNAAAIGQAAAGEAAVPFLRTLPLGTRVVVRRREADGFHDALGYLRAIDADTATIETRRKGEVVVLLAKVTRVKTVPPPPPRRAPRFPLPPDPAGS